MEAVMELNEMCEIGELVARFHWDAVAEVATIHVLGGVVKLGHSCRDRACHARADDEGDEFDDGEEDRHSDQGIHH